MMADPMDKLRTMRMSAEHTNRQAKRELWRAIQTRTPELAAQTAEIHERFGITGGACGGALWGDIDAVDQQWIHNR